MLIARKLLLLVAMVGVFTLLSDQGTTAAQTRGNRQCQVNHRGRLTVSRAEPAKVVEIDVDANCNVIMHAPRTISIDEAKTIAGRGNNASATVYKDLAPVSLLVSPDVCHSYQAVADPVDIRLTELWHNTSWNFSGTTVSLNWMSTSAGWHYTTGWSLTAGPSQQVVDGNGGWSDQTRGQASFQWIGGQHQHTLKNDNQVRGNGSCQVFWTVVGTVPSVSHMVRTSWITES